MLVGEPHDGIERAQRLYAVGFAQEFLLISKTKLDFGIGEYGSCQRIGRSVEELCAVVFVAGTEAQIGLDIVGKSCCKLQFGHVFAHMDVLIESVFVFRL